MDYFKVITELKSLKALFHAVVFAVVAAIFLIFTSGLMTLQKVNALTERIEQMEQVADSTAINEVAHE